MHTSHWAVGWYDHIMVKTTSRKAMECLHELFMYTRWHGHLVIDEEDMMARELEQANNAYDNWAKWDVSKMAEAAHILRLLDDNGFYRPEPEDEEMVKALVAEAIMEYDSFEGSYKDEYLVELLKETFSDVEPDVLTISLPLQQ
jgi:hypothetical protein